MKLLVFLGHSCLFVFTISLSTVSINWYFLNCNVNTQIIVVFAAKAAEEWRQGVSNYFQYWGVISQSRIAIFPPRHSPPIQKYVRSQPGLSNVKVSCYTPQDWISARRITSRCVVRGRATAKKVLRRCSNLTHFNLLLDLTHYLIRHEAKVSIVHSFVHSAGFENRLSVPLNTFLGEQHHVFFRVFPSGRPHYSSYFCKSTEQSIPRWAKYLKFWFYVGHCEN